MANSAQILRRIESIDEEIGSLLSRIESLKKERERLVIANDVNSELGIYDEEEDDEGAEQDGEKQTLGDRVSKLFVDYEEKTVQEIFDALIESGIEVGKATVNTTLYNLAKKGILEASGRGVYKLAEI